MFAPSPLAFGFVNVAILGWLAAAAAPILIHLWMRHVHRDTPWAAMEFLREAIKRNARKLRLQQWILLALRTLVILFVVLAAAKPFLSGWQLLGAGPKVHRLLVFDTSMSMQYEINDQSRFARAQELADELLDGTPSGGVYSVCTMGQSPQAVIARPTSDRDRVRRAVQNLRVSSGGARLPETLELIEQILTEATHDNRDIERHEVIVFTDLTKHPWNMAVVDATATPVDSRVAQQLASIGKRSEVVAIDVGVPEVANVSISQLAVAGAFATTSAPVQVDTLVTNHSRSPMEEVSVQLLVNGRAIDEQTTSLAPEQGTTLSFEIPFHAADWHSVSVRTAGDSLPADDQAYLALKVPERVRILCVEGEPRAARYIARALNPSGEPTSPLEPVVVGEGALSELTLADYQCVFVCNVTRFTPAEVALLSHYVDQGGGLVVFLGDRVLAEAYNEAFVSKPDLRPQVQRGALQPSEFGSMDQDRALLPATIGSVVTNEATGIDPLDYQHPIVAAFRGRERAGLLTTPITTYLSLTPHTQQGAKVAFATASGDPLLVTQTFGKGVVALVATAASLDTVDPTTRQPWTLLPAWPSFLPIVRELVAYTSPVARNQVSLQVGEAIGGELPSYWAEPTVAIVRPDSRIDTVPVEREGAQARWNYASVDLPGIYTARSTTGDVPLAMESVNVDPRESDLARVDIEQLHAAIKLRRDYSASGIGQGGLASSTPLHRWLLHAVLGLLLLESVLAWWFGRGTA